MISTKHNERQQIIRGPVGQLELILAQPIGPERGAWGIICHPHSLHGGSMNNKVVTTLAKAYQHLGVHTVRFNFRGVGQSAGRYDQGNGELDDLLAVINWLLHEKPDQKIWLGGFSFGAYVAFKAATRIPVERLTVVAPPVHHFNMQDMSPVMGSWVLVQGERDDVVPAEAVFEWAKTMEPPPKILRFPNAGHFFHGQLIELREKLEKVLSNA